MDLYETLGVGKDATDAQIKAAYRKASKQCHPDKYPNNEEKAQQFKNITLAFEILSDPAKRTRYDQTGDVEGADNSRSALLGVLMAGFQKALHQISTQGGEFEKHNIVELMRFAFTTGKDVLKQKVELNRKTIDTYTKIAKRFSRIGQGENTMANLAMAPVKDLQAELESYEEEIKLTDLAMEELSNFVYNYDKPDPQQRRGGWNVYMMNGNGWMNVGKASWNGPSQSTHEPPTPEQDRLDAAAYLEEILKQTRGQ